MPSYEEEYEALEQMRTFGVHLPKLVNPDREGMLVGLLKESREAFVWPGSDRTRPTQWPEEALQSEKGKHRLNTEAAVRTMADFRPFWHAGSWGRGSVALRLPLLADPEGLFSQCSSAPGCGPGPSILSSRNQLTHGHSKGAIQYADRVVTEGDIVLLLPASNGTEWVDLFAPPEDLRKLFRIASVNLSS